MMGPLFIFEQQSSFSTPAVDHLITSDIQHQMVLPRPLKSLVLKNNGTFIGLDDDQLVEVIETSQWAVELAKRIQGT
ncbi:unnamed protein product, partial [Mesorhabditis spiculigera]